MTSKKEYLVPEHIEPEVAQQMVGGVMKVEPLTTKMAHLGDKDKTKIAQLWCHSPRVINNSLGLCNHSIGAVVGGVKGHARMSMLLECPKCRTAYAVTLDVDGEKETVELVESKVVNLNRGVQAFVESSLDSEKDTWIQVHEKKS